MAQTIKVTAPYVTLKVKDQAGSDVITGYYEGAVVENVDDESAKSHIDKGMAEKVSGSGEPETAADGNGGSPDEASDVPKAYASKGDWVEYAVSQGMTQEEAEAQTRDQLAERYGS